VGALTTRPGSTGGSTPSSPTSIAAGLEASDRSTRPATASGGSSAAAVSNPGEPIHRHDVDPVPRRLRHLAGQVLKTCFERPSTMCSSLAGPGPGAHSGQVDDHGDVLVPAAGVTPRARRLRPQRRRRTSWDPSMITRVVLRPGPRRSRWSTTPRARRPHEQRSGAGARSFPATTAVRAAAVSPVAQRHGMSRDRHA
jgi:hypothetical protein